MHAFNIHEAKTHFSKLVDSAMNGEEVIIARSGKPVAKLVPILPQKIRRKIGVLKGKIKIAEDFDAPLPDEIITAFEGVL